jgi:serine/threonine protein kinase
VAGPSLGRFRLLNRIAMGGMGEVYRGVDVGWGGIERPVAVKLIAPAFARDPDFVRTFVDEAKLSFLLCHGNIVQVRDIGQTDETYFIAMEWVDGADLGALLRALELCGGPPMPLDLAVLVVVEAARGLDYAHRLCDAEGRPLNVVHRDVSPSNLLLSYEGEVKVTDFGIARSRLRQGHSIPGVLKGKIGYLAPEQACGLPIDLRADVFALGALLYEAVTGKNPFTYDNDDRKALERVRTGSFPPPGSFASLPPELEAIILRAMAPDVAERYPSCGALRGDLEAFARHVGYALSPSDLGQFVRELCVGQCAEPPAATLTHTPVAPRVPSARPPDPPEALGGDHDDPQDEETTMPGHRSSPKLRGPVAARRPAE